MTTTLSILSIAFAFMSFLIATISYFQDHRRRKKQATIEYYSTMSDELFEVEKSFNRKLGGADVTPDLLESSPELMAQATKLLISYERLGVGVNSGVYDFHLLNRMAGSHIILLYNLFSSYIDHIRVDNRRRTSYVEFETLTHKLMSLRSTYRNRGKM